MNSKLESQIPALHHCPKTSSFGSRVKRYAGAGLLCLSVSCLLILRSHSLWRKPLMSSQISHDLAQFQKCSIDNILSTGLPFLDSASPLPIDEFVERRTRLAKALVADQVDAFVVEPGYTFQYYANISQPDWEVWEPEERPFLMIIQAFENQSTGDITPRTSFLAPHFECERVRLLNMPFKEELILIPWEEHWNPYETLREWWDSNPVVRLGLSSENAISKIIVDEEMRDFIQRGLATNGFDVIGLGGETEKVKQTKSPREVEILRAVNTGTVVAVRAMRDCMYAGLSEDEVMKVLDNTMRAAGMEPFFDIVLFDGNAANPHGGTDGSKVLEAGTMVLIDVGAHLYGYSSDICRTFFPPFFPKPTTEGEIQALPSLVKEQLSVWNTVLEAQTQSMHAMRPGNSLASADIAARKVITEAGYGDEFTHRLGHGIGIKAHESPYMNKGNLNQTFSAGMVFTSEPGVYLVDRYGIRHEDILLVTDNGEPDVLTGIRAIGPWDP